MRLTIERYAMLSPDQPIGVAVSGGADSVCLVHLLLELGYSRLVVLHVDHSLRGAESLDDARFVRDLAERLGLEFRLHTVDLTGCGENIEQAGRNARYGFFREMLAAKIVARIALGHTRSDQAETVLFRFLRGSGTAGLSGIRPVTSGGIVRPLIDISREEVEAWLRERGIAWRQDSSNAAETFARNRIRHTLLPQLTADWNPALSDTLANVADQAFEDEKYWAAEIERRTAGNLIRARTAILAKADLFTACPVAVGRRLIRRAIELAKGDLRSVDFAHIEQIRVLAGAPEGHGRLQIPGVDVFRSFDWLRLAKPGLDRLDNRNFRIPLSIPGSARLPEDAGTIDFELLARQQDPSMSQSRYNEEVNRLDWGRISGPLDLRNWRPGDRYRRIGHAGEEKIKTLFQLARIPLWERRNWPVITLGDKIVWSRRFGPDSEFAVNAETRTVLHIRETAATGDCWNL